MKNLLNDLVTELQAFNPLLVEAAMNGMTAEDVLFSDEVPAIEKVGLMKAIARASFKRLALPIDHLAVEAGLDASFEERKKLCTELLEYLTPLYANNAAACGKNSALGHYSVRVGQRFVEITDVDKALSEPMLALKNRVVSTSYFS
jgi:hypothetical protein